jgi:hypothetical protein
MTHRPTPLARASYTPIRMPYPVRAVLRAVPLLALLLVAACAEPPSKEMNQAQGAIDAARAAGADRYAADEFKAAVDALAHSEQAVRDNDYRLALNHALDSRERAQNAARLAVDGRAQARGDAERMIAEVATLVTRLRSRLAEPDIARLPPRVRRDPIAAVEAADRAVQEARTALSAEEYYKVDAALKGQAVAVEAGLKELDAAAGSTAGRRGR